MNDSHGSRKINGPFRIATITAAPVSKLGFLLFLLALVCFVLCLFYLQINIWALDKLLIDTSIRMFLVSAALFAGFFFFCLTCRRLFRAGLAAVHHLHKRGWASFEIFLAEVYLALKNAAITALMVFVLLLGLFVESMVRL